MKKLSEKQKAFADYYIETLNATEAAKRAGYKQPNVQGTQLIQKASVQDYIKVRLESKDKERIATQDEVLEFLTNVMRGTITNKVVTQEGIEIDVPPDFRERIKSAELLGKRYKTFIDRVEQDNNHAGEVNVNIKVIE